MHWACGLTLPSTHILRVSMSQHLPMSETILATLWWLPKENNPAIATGMMTMISVYLNLFNINLTAWFAAVILDGQPAKLATLPMMLPSIIILG